MSLAKGIQLSLITFTIIVLAVPILALGNVFKDVKEPDIVLAVKNKNDLKEIQDKVSTRNFKAIELIKKDTSALIKFSEGVGIITPIIIVGVDKADAAILFPDLHLSAGPHVWPFFNITFTVVQREQLIRRHKTRLRVVEAAISQASCAYEGQR